MKNSTNEMINKGREFVTEFNIHILILQHIDECPICKSNWKKIIHHISST